MKSILLFSLVVVLNLSCTTRNKKDTYSYKEIKLNGEVVKGRMNSDSVYNGEIKFYRDGKLIETRNYINGVSQGKVIDFFADGKISQISYDKDGLTTGESTVFDSSGRLFMKQFNYFGKAIGPQIIYDSTGTPSQFLFINFENETICSLNYLSSRLNVESGELLNPTFQEVNVGGKDMVSIFTYLIRPPKLKCDYSICLMVDTTKRSIKTVKEIKSNDFYYQDNFPAVRNKYYCVTLHIYDSLQGIEKTFVNVYK